MNTTTLIQSPRGLACDGCGVAKDDLLAIETMEKQEECIHELFHNAARIHKAMHSNHLLRPIFRKYREVCREILQKKKDESEQLAMLSEYCDECGAHDPHQQKHDLKYIQSEIGEILNEIKRIEEMQWTDDDDSDSESESEFDSESDCSEDKGDESSEQQSEHSESEHSDSDSDSDTESDLSEVIEFLRQSQFE